MGAIVDRTIFGGLDLRTVNGLETLQHMGPSTIGTNTIERSHGELPEVFLRGAGLSDTFIAYARSLAQRPIEYYTCFLSYSSKDQDFAERLYADLQSGGVRCWFAPEDMKTGDRIRQRIEENSRNTLVLFPIRLDNAVMESETSWAAHIRRMRHITDFSRWEQPDRYQKALFRLLRDLQPDTAPKGGNHHDEC